MSKVGLVFFWMIFHVIISFCNLEHYKWKLWGLFSLKKPMNYFVPLTWAVGLIFSCCGIVTGLGSIDSSYSLEVSIQLLAVGFLATFTAANKLLLNYLRPEYSLYRMGLVFSLTACTQALILNILLGVTNSGAGGLFFPMLLITVLVQFAYGFFLKTKGYLAKPQEQDIDLGLNDPNILSNYIKIV